MTRRATGTVDLFLQEVLDSGVDYDELGRLAEWLAPAAPRAALREQVLQDLGGRLHEFAEVVSTMLDVSIERAQTLLDGIDDPDAWKRGPHDDVMLYEVRGGERVADALNGFVRVVRGGIFPEHSHLGDEEVLIVQGRCRDSFDGRVLGPGDRTTRTTGSSHHIDVLPGPALVFLAVVRSGVEVGGRTVRAAV